MAITLDVEFARQTPEAKSSRLLPQADADGGRLTLVRIRAYTSRRYQSALVCPRRSELQNHAALRTQGATLLNKS